MVIIRQYIIESKYCILITVIRTFTVLVTSMRSFFRIKESCFNGIPTVDGKSCLERQFRHECNQSTSRSQQPVLTVTVVTMTLNVFSWTGNVCSIEIRIITVRILRVHYRCIGRSIDDRKHGTSTVSSSSHFTATVAHIVRISYVC